MPWPFQRSRRDRGPALERRLLRSADRSAVARRWSLRFEEEARLALADLADALEELRRSGDLQQRTLALATTRDALDRVAEDSADPTVAEACALFGQLLAAPRQSAALRVQAAQVALETLTFLVLADGEERRRRGAEALRQLALAASRAAA